MKDSPFALVGVLLFGLVLGYVAGMQRETSVPFPVPGNYDPGRALCTDALKEQQAATERCWNGVVTRLIKERDHAEKTPAREE